MTPEIITRLIGNLGYSVFQQTALPPQEFFA